MKKKTLSNWAVAAGKMVHYNLKVVFADKFLYFLLASAVFFAIVVLLSLFDPNTRPNQAVVYYWLLVPGMLLVFYPSVFGLQHDVDVRILEILFGVPNYRYKVWLVRLLLIFFLVAALLFLFALFSTFGITSIPVSTMVLQVMVPVCLIGAYGFWLSTAVKSGYGAAVLVIITALAFWILSGSLAESKWNLFLNPFAEPQNVSDLVWHDVLIKNRLYQGVASVILILSGLLNLQKREKFI